MEHSPETPSSPISESNNDGSDPSDTSDNAQPSEQKAAIPSTTTGTQPPLPNQDVPPLPNEAPPLPDEVPPTVTVDDGWEPAWDAKAQAFYFYNRFTNVTQWENPRVPEPSKPTGPPGVEPQGSPAEAQRKENVTSGYNPAIHGDYDPDADYAKVQSEPFQTEAPPGTTGGPAELYGATGTFNRFTGKWQSADFTPDRFSDESKSKRQMNAFFDVDAAANSHDGRSLRAERANKKLSKKELKDFKEKRREKKEEKRRAWLRD